MKIMPIEQCGAVSKCFAHPSSYKDSAKNRYSYSEPTQRRIAEVALTKLEEARKIDVERHEKNLPALEVNNAIRLRISSLMEEVGMPKSFRVQKASRSMYPKYETKEAGYLDDIKRACPVSDGFDTATASYERLKKVYEDYLAAGVKAAEEAATQKEREEQRKREERKANVELAKIILRYSLDEESDWPQVLEALRYRDQRIDLALAMSDTRGDWSDGPYRVSDALGRFKIETDEDKDIVRSVADGLVDFCDGRVFRDCHWNYGELFASVEDKQLVADVQLAHSKVSVDY